MKKYICSICNYVYDEEVGSPKENIAPYTKWEDVPDDWVCPLCGASKDAFIEDGGNETTNEVVSVVDVDTEEIEGMSLTEISGLFSNLSKGCEKQYLFEESELFDKLSEYYKNKSGTIKIKKIGELSDMIINDLEIYPSSFKISREKEDRGALRALTWSEKVTRIINSVLIRYEKDKNLLDGTNIYVCEICGYIHIGNQKPEICPICKVPNTKIIKV